MRQFSAGWLILTLFVLVPRSLQAQDASRSASVGAGSVGGAITFINGQYQMSPLEGVSIALTSVTRSTQPLSSVTDEQGRYQFTALVDGVYKLELSPDGFEPQSVTVTIANGAAVVRNFSMHLATVVQTAVVRGEEGQIETESSNSAATVTNKQINDLPLGKHNTNAFLVAPVVPTVVQTPNGELNIKGAAETQGMLLVNSAETVDPVTGNFEIPVPVDAIQSVSVIETAYRAEYGGFSGGLTEIETKPPSDRWQFGLNDMIPGFRGKNGRLVGIQDEDPRVVVTGPALKGKLNFTEVATFQFDRPPVRGLAWPYNEIVTRGAGTMTIVQAILSDKHLLDVSMNLFSNQVQFADINALVPQLASSDDRQHGFWVGVNDSYQLAGGMLLNTVLRYTRLDSSARGQGSAAMLITPDGWGGNYFDSWTRTGEQVQGLSTLRFPAIKWHGNHDVKLGADFTNRSYSGVDQAHPVQLLNEGGGVMEQIVFQGSGRLHASDREFSEFVEDHWTATDRLAFDLGTRLINQSAGRDIALAPRAAIAYSPEKSQKTVIRSGAGLFYDRVPLLSLDFTDNLTRVVSIFDGNGNVIAPPVRYQNTYLQPIAEGGFLPTGDVLDTVSRNFTWNAEVDRELLRDLTLRVSYLQSQTRNLPVVLPMSTSASTGGNTLLGLASTGSSRYYGLQTTVRYQPSSRQEFDISYLHSRARGDLNVLSSIFVPFEQPVIHPNVNGILPFDVPNRVVVWGTFTLPWQLVVSPVADIHTGLPYSVMDTLQNYVGVPNSARYPYYFSLDLQGYRDFPMNSLPFLSKVKNRIVRFGIFSFDVTNHRNPNAVFNTLTSPYFGGFAGFSRRVDGFLFEIH